MTTRPVPSPPLEVVLRRGSVVEARHRVHAVVVQGGRVIAEAGDSALVTHFRSSAKPIQALPLARARPDLADDELAIACASHLATAEQLDAVRRLLADAPAEDDELECGFGPTRLRHTCSGKHAGFLALCRARGWASAGYRLADHPCQRLMLTEIAAAAEVEPRSVPTAIDGCGVVTFALPLERMAHAFGRFPQLDGAARVGEAMRANPDLIQGPSSVDAMMMRGLPGWMAKVGAEGLLCACSGDGVGVVLKVEDGGDWRAVRPALAEILRRVGDDLGADFGVVQLANSRGEPVAELAIA
ncbi:MAG: asparaginase [Gaiellaceae bacterium]